MKFNFFVLILCLMIHFIAQASIGNKTAKIELESKDASAQRALAGEEKN